MSRLFLITVLVAISVAAVHASRECYVCDSSEDSGFKSSKACKKDTFDTTVVPVIRVPRSEKECYACFKHVDSEDDVSRGCLSKKDYKALKGDVYKWKGTDDCKKNDGAEMCICQNNYCNGAGFVSVSFFAIISAALLKFVF